MENKKNNWRNRPKENNDGIEIGKIKHQAKELEEADLGALKL